MLLFNVRKTGYFVLTLTIAILLIVTFFFFSGNKMEIKSPAFKNNGKIPSKYTCDSENASPPLEFSNVPKDAKSLVLIMDDPDAPSGMWVHWVVFNIPPKTSLISENEEPNGIQGMTSFGSEGYGGPCPPDGEHRYFFKIYALGKILDLSEGATKKEIELAMKGHIIEQAEMVGRYEKV